MLQALDVSELDKVGTLHKPDFISHPHKYFRTHEEAEAAARNLREKDSSPGKSISLTHNGKGIPWKAEGLIIWFILLTCDIITHAFDDSEFVLDYEAEKIL